MGELEVVEMFDLLKGGWMSGGWKEFYRMIDKATNEAVVQVMGEVMEHLMI